MTFDPENSIIKLCARGMESEGHFVARHQQDIKGKLQWDETALEIALKINQETVKASYPSLYLNIAKCHEDLGAKARAEVSYKLALAHLEFLPEDGYGHMIRLGVLAGMARLLK